MSKHGGRWGSVDVVILAALSLEYEAVRQVDAGAVEGSQWEEERRPNGLQVAFRAFHGKKGSRLLRVAVGLTTALGSVGTITALYSRSSRPFALARATRARPHASYSAGPTLVLPGSHEVMIHA